MSILTDQYLLWSTGVNKFDMFAGFCFLSESADIFNKKINLHFEKGVEIHSNTYMIPDNYASLKF